MHETDRTLIRELVSSLKDKGPVAWALLSALAESAASGCMLQTAAAAAAAVAVSGCHDV